LKYKWILSGWLFLSILGRMQIIAHHEVETVKLLNGWLRAGS